MTPYTPSPSFHPAISLVDNTDAVIGGLTGTANVATKQLADNDTYLYGILGGFEAANVYNDTVSSVVNLTAANCYRALVAINQLNGTYYTANLPQASSYPANGRIVIQRQTTGTVRPVKVLPYAGDAVVDRYGNSIANLYLQDGDTVVLYKVNTTAWRILSFDGGFYNVGDQCYGYNVKAGTLQRKGQIVNRADYPRLWAWANGISGLVVSDATWLATGTPQYPNKSFFSSGDGTATFRLPDDRGLFDRAMDLSADVDVDRFNAGLGSQAGNKQGDALRQHNHNFTPPIAGGSGSQIAAVNGNTNGAFTAYTTAFAGGTETRPVNVAKQPLIVY